MRQFSLKTLFACLLLIISFGLAVWTILPHQSTASSHAGFEIVVEKTEDGFKFTCNEGCAWEEATRACDGSADCRTLLESRGIGRAPEGGR